MAYNLCHYFYAKSKIKFDIDKYQQYNSNIDCRREKENAQKV